MTFKYFGLGSYLFKNLFVSSSIQLLELVIQKNSYMETIIISLLETFFI